MLKDGDKIKDFTLRGIKPGEEEKQYTLSDIIKTAPYTILYFYPKDDTPGCTTEACDFTDNMNRLTGKANVIGVSRDSIDKHIKFQSKYNLNFPLLTDKDIKVHKVYDAWGEKNMYGKITTGVKRSTFIIKSDGTIVKAMRNVVAKGHVEKILKEL